MATMPKWRRVLLKLSGEALAGNGQASISAEVVHGIALELKEIWEEGIQITLIVGGGNIFRGSQAAQVGMDRATADYAGMLATVINALFLQDALEKVGVDTRVQTAIQMQEVAEPFIRRRAEPAPGEGPYRHLCRRHGQPLLHDGYRRAAPRQ